MPTGTVATTMSSASRWVEVSTRRVRSTVKNAPITSTQVRAKNTSSATAVATCSATMNAR